MTNFNFDPQFFRRVILKCEHTQQIPSLTQLVREAVEAFYNEFDYYPDIGVYAPGVFSIMGSHTDYFEGCLVQGALPLITVIVGKSLNTSKCKVVSTLPNTGKAIFPISYPKKRRKMYPQWVNYLKGVINVFPCTDLKGFDALIHSSIPVKVNMGSSSALQVAFYTFLEATCGYEYCSNIEEKGRLCHLCEKAMAEPTKKIGVWDTITSSVAVERSLVKVNCSEMKSSVIDIRDTDITFLIILSNDLELDDSKYILQREVEVKLAAKLIGVEYPKDLSEAHLEVLANMEDPTREVVTEILLSFGLSDEFINEFVDNLFDIPKPESDFGEQFYGESMEIEKEIAGEMSNTEGAVSEKETENEEGKEISNLSWDPKESKKLTTRVPPASPVSYIHEIIARFCPEKDSLKNLVMKPCQEINCLGGIENLSVASDLTVIKKLLRRVRHLVTENSRSNALPDIISRLDFVEFGSKLIESHLSLKVDFEVSCPTLDGLVELAIDTDRVFGAKMMGGGASLILLHRSAVEEYVNKVTETLGEKFQFYLVFPFTGARIINLGVRSIPKSVLSSPYPNLKEMCGKAVENFHATYKYPPTCGAYSPGNLNLIGDHTDYNHGFCICMALSMVTVVVGAFNGTSKIRAATTMDVGDQPRKVILGLPILEKSVSSKIKWAKLVMSVTKQFEGILKGFDCLIESCVPSSSGVGSKVALTTAFYTFLENLTGQPNPDLCKKAYECMMVIQNTTGIVSGISEPTIAIRAKEDFVTLLDCKSVSTTFIPFQNTDVALVLLFSKSVMKNNRAQLYTRMEECKAVARALGAKTLRCLTLEELDALNSSGINKTYLKRAKHVITENERVLKATEALKNHDFETFGEIMVSSHISLRDDFEVTTKELDFLVERAMEVDGVLGSKMPCSGNENCTVSLVKRWAVDDFIEYLQSYSTDGLSFCIVTPFSGSNVLQTKEYQDIFSNNQMVFEKIFPF